MADKFTLPDHTDSPDSNQLRNENIDESFFEEFSFDDFGDGMPGGEEDIRQTISDEERSQIAGQYNEPLPTPGKPLGDVADYNYEKMLGDADLLAPKTEIEPGDPMLDEFENALAAEIQRVTKERESEKERLKTAGVLQRTDMGGLTGTETGKFSSGVRSESIKAGGWSRRRRSQAAADSNTGRVPSDISAKVPAGPDEKTDVPPVFGGRAAEEAPAREEAESVSRDEERIAAREEERRRAAAARAERVQAAKAAQAEAERLSAIARAEEEEAARAEEARREKALSAALEEDQERVQAESEKTAIEAAIREGEEREEFEEAARNLKAPKTPVVSRFDDDDDDDEGGGKGRVLVTVTALLIILLLGVAAGMTFFWSNLSLKDKDNGAGNPVPVSQSDLSADTSDNAVDESVNVSPTLSPDESRYLDESRAAKAAFEEEQKAALARAEELEQEERAAKLAEAGMVGLPDISTRDLSEYLTEMPPDGKSICSTSTVLYSYDQMVKDLYFLTVKYGDFISMNTLGTTMDQRAIYEALIGNANAKYQIVMYYALDGSEYINTVLAMNQLESYCKARKNGASYKNHALDSIFEDVCIHIVPMANPDGTAICQYGIDALRTVEARDEMQKTYDSDVIAERTTEPIDQYAVTYSANAAGVDLDRNFSIGWEEYSEGPDKPSASGYKGTEALSEPETKALAELAEKCNAAAVIGYGTSGGLVEHGFGYEGPAEVGVSGLSNIGTNSLISALTDKTGYSSVEIPGADEKTGGRAIEYFLHEKHIPAVKVETGSGEKDPLDISEMSSIWKANSEVYQMIGNLYTNGL